jgi:hypothetical protein
MKQNELKSGFIFKTAYDNINQLLLIIVLNEQVLIPQAAILQMFATLLLNAFLYKLFCLIFIFIFEISEVKDEVDLVYCIVIVLLEEQLDYLVLGEDIVSD